MSFRRALISVVACAPGGAGRVTVTGGNGDDLFVAGAGADAYNGAAGTDRIDFSARIGPVPLGPSSAGAIGWTQFMPATWKEWGMDAGGDGKADPYDAVDAIYSSARYLRASGAPGSYRKALFAYNHAAWYVKRVLAAAKKYG